MKKSLWVAALALVAAGAAQAQATDTLKKIKDSGAITLGVRESSTGASYVLTDGSYAGYQVELCQKVVEDIRKQLGLAKVDIKYQPVTSANRIPQVSNGSVDLECGTTTNNLNRQKDVAFSVTTYAIQVRIAARKSANITSIAQLNGKTVATTTGTTSVQLLRKHERATGVDFKEVFGKDHADSFQLLAAGRADAFVMDAPILAGLIASSQNPTDFVITGEPLSVEPIALMLRKDDPAFKKAVDDSLTRMMKSGEIEKIYNKWFMSVIPQTKVPLNLAVIPETRAAWANPNDKPAEDYATKK